MPSGDITFREEACTVSVGGNTIRLTRTEYRLLEALCFEPELVLSRSVLADLLWGRPTFRDGHNLEVIVSRIRQKFKDAHLGATTIRSVRGLGYRFELGQYDASRHSVYLLVGRDRCISWITPNVTELMRYRPSALVGRSITEFIYADDLRLVEVNERSVASGQAATFDMRLRSADQHYRSYGIHVRPVFMPPTQLLGVLANVIDREHLASLETIAEPVFIDHQ
jgi:hypothetical protein